MPLEQTVTVVNNSGRIISTGKQLLSIFKEAKGAYAEKKAEIESERSAPPWQPLEGPRSVYRVDDSRRLRYDEASRRLKDSYHDHDDKYEDEHGHDDYYYSYSGRRHSHDVAASETASRRSRRSSRHPHHHHHHHHQYHGDRDSYHHQRRPRGGGALTESNLQALSEVSATAPSSRPQQQQQQQQQQPSPAYRSPYAETMPPLDVALSRLDASRPPPPADAALMPRRRSEPDFGAKELDMHLAYGNVPPDLADRVDLDPAHDAGHAQQLVRKVEGLLVEAHCLQHSASTIIKSLQEKPNTAAEVALTLADLSSAVAKMSPSFLGLLKGGSPAVFALLASPHFLIGTSIAVGVTVVMFGGWKIVKKVAEADKARVAMIQDAGQRQQPPPPHMPADSRHQSSGVEEALVIDDELSTIETWRRGIPPGGPDDESADLELITPQADRATREKYAKDDIDLDLRSRRSSARTRRSTRTHRREERDPKERDSRDRGSKDRDRDPKGGGSRDRDRDPKDRGSGDKDRDRRRSTPDAASVAGASDTRSRRSARDRPPKALDDGRASTRGDGDALDALFRPRARHGDNMLKAVFRSKKDKEA